MKRYLLAGLLALGISAVTQQQAAAGFQLNCGASYYLSLSCGGGGCNSGYGGNPCFNGWGGGYPGFNGWGGGYPGFYGGYPGCYDGYGLGGYPVTGSTTQPATKTTPTAPVKQAQYPVTGLEPVGYYQAPSYWYGN